MGFRVILYREHRNLPLEPAEVDVALLELPHMTRTGQDVREYTCRHPATGESFVFVLSRSTAPACQVAASGPSLDFCIDYSVSQPVVADAFSIVFHLAERLRTRVHNLHEPKGFSEPENPKALMSSFIEHRDASARAAKGVPLPLEFAKVTRDRMDYCHSYLQRRNILEDTLCGTGAYVPEQIFLLRPPGANSVVRVVTWPDCHPMVFPEVDYVCVERDKRGMFGLTVGRDRGLVPFAHILRLLGSDLQRQETPIAHYVYSRPEPRPEAKKAVDKLDLLSAESFLEPEWAEIVEV
jgi:hypothetical protein